MGYLTSAQIESAMAALAARPNSKATRVPLPKKTQSLGMGPTTYSFMKITAGNAPNKVTVLVTGGMHAREWPQPDAIISFATKLLDAYDNKAGFIVPAYTDTTGSTFGPYSIGRDRVKEIVEKLNILLLPLANPDGRTWDMDNPPASGSLDAGWRKNRAPRPLGADPADPDTIGVDINRNFDIAWDVHRFYSPAGAAQILSNTSEDSADETFKGTVANSEPEVLNIIWLLENNPVKFFADLHGRKGLVMYPWGIEQNGEDDTKSDMRITNAAYDGKRDASAGDAYKEYFPNSPTKLREQHKLYARDMRDAIKLATGKDYQFGGIADTIYSAVGSSTDYAFQRQFAVGGFAPVYAFAFEFGFVADTFKPPFADPHGFPRVEREIHAALLKLLELALPPVAPSSGCCLTVIAAGLASGPAMLEVIRQFRDVWMMRPAARGAMLALDRAYRRVSRGLAPFLERHRLSRQLAAVTILIPVAGLAWLMTRTVSHER